MGATEEIRESKELPHHLEDRICGCTSLAIVPLLVIEVVGITNNLVVVVPLTDGTVHDFSGIRL